MQITYFQEGRSTNNTAVCVFVRKLAVVVPAVSVRSGLGLK